MKKTLTLLFVSAVCALFFCGCDSKSPEENLIEAIQKAQEGKWKEAGKYADRAVAGAPDNVGSLIMRAIACEKNDNYDQAVDSARRAVALDPESFAALYTLGRLYSSHPMRNAEAINTLNAALRIRPESAEARVIICNVLSRMGAVEGRTYLAKLHRLEEYKSDPALYSQLGVIYSKMNNLAWANKMLVTAFKLAENDPDVVFNIARFSSEYIPRKQLANKLYSRFEQLARGKEIYTAELDEAKAAIGR